MHARSIAGQQAEEHVVHYLKAQGFAIVARNYQKMYGEIDIIARHKNVLAFVEVKMRKSDLVPLTALIPLSKQRKIIAVARDYIVRHAIDYNETICRFDVALVHDKQINYIPNAFTQSDDHDRYY